MEGDKRKYKEGQQRKILKSETFQGVREEGKGKQEII